MRGMTRWRSCTCTVSDETCLPYCILALCLTDYVAVLAKLFRTFSLARYARLSLFHNMMVLAMLAISTAFDMTLSVICLDAIEQQG